VPAMRVGPIDAHRSIHLAFPAFFEMAPHPPYSPNLAPSDFFLFGHVKHVLEEADFPSEETLLAAIQRVLSDPTSDTLRAIFAKWVERLN
jgi:hypothetical protein